MGPSSVSLFGSTVSSFLYVGGKDHSDFLFSGSIFFLLFFLADKTTSLLFEKLQLHEGKKGTRTDRRCAICMDLLTYWPFCGASKLLVFFLCFILI